MTPSRLYGMPGECPVTRNDRRCNAHTRQGAFMCAPHWRRVPRPLRDAMFRAWRGWQAAPDDPAAWEAFLAARTDALEAAA